MEKQEGVHRCPPITAATLAHQPECLKSDLFDPCPPSPPLKPLPTTSHSYCFLTTLLINMSAKRTQLLRRFEAATSASNTSSFPGTSRGGLVESRPSHPAFNRVDDLKIKQLEEVEAVLFILAHSQTHEPYRTINCSRKGLLSLEPNISNLLPPPPPWRRVSLLFARNTRNSSQSVKIQNVKLRLQMNYFKLLRPMRELPSKGPKRQRFGLKNQNAGLVKWRPTLKNRNARFAMANCKSLMLPLSVPVTYVYHLLSVIHLTSSSQLLLGLAENFKCGICLEVYTIPYR